MLIWSGSLFTCDSRGNGAFVTLINETTRQSIFLQGDDAVAFDAERELVETAHPDWHGDRVYAQLWDNCGWGEAAVDLEECGCCGCSHRVGFQGDCREDNERFA